MPAEHDLLPAWRRGPVSALPMSVTPFAAETVQSYLDRLAHANHLDPATLRRYLCETGRRGEPRIDWLATASGHPTDRLRARLIGAGEADRDASRQRRHGRPACRFCMVRRQVSQPVYCWYPNYRTVCARHMRWIGPFTHTVDDQRDLRSAPAVRAAARRHARLYRANPAAATYLLNEARRILRRWRVVETGAAPSAITDIDSYIANYPDLIDLASILADSHDRLLDPLLDSTIRAQAVKMLYARLVLRFPCREDHSDAVEQWLHDHQLIAKRPNGSTRRTGLAVSPADRPV